MTTQPSSAPIVVGIDGSTAALDAARWAARQARRDGAALRLVHAYELPFRFPSGMTKEESILHLLHDQGRRWLEQAQAAAADAVPGLAITTLLEAAPVNTLLLQESEDAALVVLGASGRGALTGLLAGSTSLAIAGHVQCPVVVVRGAEPARETGPVVVGVDGTPVSDAAIAYAFAEASARGADLLAVHAWTESLFEASLAGGSTLIDLHGLAEDAEHTVAAQLAEWQKKYPDVRVTREVVHDRAGRALARRARTAALVVVGSRSRGGFRGLVLGSTSQHLLHHADCPVTVVRTETPPE